MEIIDIDGKDGLCLKCHVGLSADERRNRIPICTKCITELVDIVKDNINIDGLEEFSDDVSDFTDFISSSARLMGLDDVVVIQVCFNVYMDGVREMVDRDPIMARKIFKDTRRFIDIELERLADSGEDYLNKNDDYDDDRRRGRDIFEKMMGSISKIMKNYHEPNGKNCSVNTGEGDINNKKDGGSLDKDDNTDTDKDDTKEEIKKESKNDSRRIRID